MSAKDLLRAVQRTSEPLNRRLRALVSRASVTAVNDTSKAQLVQVTVLSGERLSEVVRLQNFGHSAVPPAGSTALLISIGGSRTHCVVIGADHASRPRELAAGESQLYNELGDFVWLKADGETHLKARVKATVEAPEIHAKGNLTVEGTTLLKGAVTMQQTLAVTGNVTALANVSIGGNLAVTGTSTGTGAATFQGGVSDGIGSLATVRTIYNGHTHSGILRGPATTDAVNEKVPT